MIELYETSDRLIRNVPVSFTRYLYSKINWGVRLVEINGTRGVGKTTMLLQRARELNQQENGKALFVSLDDPWFYSHSLIDTASEFFRNGGITLFLDEVHKSELEYSSGKAKQATAAEITETLVKIKDGTSVRL